MLKDPLIMHQSTKKLSHLYTLNLLACKDTHVPSSKDQPIRYATDKTTQDKKKKTKTKINYNTQQQHQSTQQQQPYMTTLPPFNRCNIHTLLVGLKHPKKDNKIFII